MKVRELGAAEARTKLDELADVLMDCVEGGASVGFMLPLAAERVMDFWARVVEGVAAGERHLLVAEDESGRIAGTVSLITAMPDNQPHRGDIAKMLVHRRARRQGVASKLITAAHELARKQTRRLLVLDTVTGSDASRIYERAGWRRSGDIPSYALFPDGTECSTSYYFKVL